MDLSEVWCLCSGRVLELFIDKELHQEKVYRLPQGKERSSGRYHLGLFEMGAWVSVLN